MCQCTFQPGNLTGWGSEGVKQMGVTRKTLHFFCQLEKDAIFWFILCGKVQGNVCKFFVTLFVQSIGYNSC